MYIKVSIDRPKEIPERKWKILLAKNYLKGRFIVGVPRVVQDENGDDIVIYGYRLLNEQIAIQKAKGIK